MNISKRKQGILAIICTIAMIVTSITVYNPREVKADTDYSKLTYNYKHDYKKDGEAFMKGSGDKKSPWKVAIDTSQSKGDIVNWMTTGAGSLNFYNEMFMNVTWHGNYADATLEINGVKVEKVENGGNGVQVFNSAEIHVNAKEWINNNAYNVVKVTSKDGSQYVTFIVATGDKAVTSSEETTTRDPSAVVWKDIANGSGYSYNDNTEVKVENVQKPSFASEQGIYMTVSNTIESVTINGVDSKKYKTQGAGVVVYLSGLVKGENTINIKYTGGEATVIIKNENETIYTVSIDGTEKQYEEGATITVPADGQGYYNVTKKEAYAPGTELTVNENMTLKSIELNVTMTKGASIRLAAPTGLRFQTTVKSGNGIAADEILNSKTVTTGTLITTLDLYTTHGNTLTKESASIYTVLDIANNGWFGEESNKETGKFCGSIIKIQGKNYGRKFIAVGYATINYSNGDTKTVYAEVTENNAKSIEYVANEVQKSAAYKNNYTDAQKAIINKYINGEEIPE